MMDGKERKREEGERGEREKREGRRGERKGKEGSFIVCLPSP